jgi:uncharacterized DUF497 family protein
MSILRVIWDIDDDEIGNVAHIAEHGISKEEAEEVLRNPLTVKRSRSSGRPIALGFTTTGRSIAVVYEQVDEESVYPVTAYEVEL